MEMNETFPPKIDISKEKKAIKPLTLMVIHSSFNFAHVR